jgi:dTDP-4-dehydrorhamnose reductase
MRIFMAGVGGMLGAALHQVYACDHTLMCTDIDANEPWLVPADFRDFADYAQKVNAFAPDVLMHIGAFTDLEYCENNPKAAFETNARSVEHAATIANAHGILLVYISTAGIFDGAKSHYDDWDKPNPLGVYARSKYQGELTVLNTVAKHYVFRAGWMMGGGPAKDKKFVNKLMKQLADGAVTLRIVDDKLGTPTYTIDFARNIERVVTAGAYGLYNMVCAGETSRLEVAREILACLGLSDRVAIEAVSSDYFATEYFAPRPACERLINRKLQLCGLDLMRDWRVALREYLLTNYASQGVLIGEAVV